MFWLQTEWTPRDLEGNGMELFCCSFCFILDICMWVLLLIDLVLPWNFYVLFSLGIVSNISYCIINTWFVVTKIFSTRDENLVFFCDSKLFFYFIVIYEICYFIVLHSTIKWSNSLFHYPLHILITKFDSQKCDFGAFN